MSPVPQRLAPGQRLRGYAHVIEPQFKAPQVNALPLPGGVFDRIAGNARVDEVLARVKNGLAG